MEQDDLAWEARQLLKGHERLQSERIKAAQTKGQKLRVETEARGFANDDRQS